MTDNPTSIKTGTLQSKQTTAFPRAQITSTLTDELLTNVRMQADIYGTQLPTNQAALLNQQVEIDSLIAVEILCAVDPFLGFEIKAEGVVREGGYSSVQEAVDHMLPRIEKAWDKENNRGKK